MSKRNKIVIAAVVVVAIVVGLMFVFRDSIPFMPHSEKQVGAEKVKEEIYITGQDLKTSKDVDAKDILKKDKNVIVVWQTKCTACESEIKAVEKLRGKYKNLNFVGLGYGENSKDVQKKMKEWDIKFTNYMLTEKFLKKNKSIESTPLILFLDKDGKEKMYRLKGNASSDNNVDVSAKQVEKELKAFDKMK